MKNKILVIILSLFTLGSCSLTNDKFKPIDKKIVTERTTLSNNVEIDYLEMIEMMKENKKDFIAFISKENCPYCNAVKEDLEVFSKSFLKIYYVDSSTASIEEKTKLKEYSLEDNTYFIEDVLYTPLLLIFNNGKVNYYNLGYYGGNVFNQSKTERFIRYYLEVDNFNKSVVSTEKLVLNKVENPSLKEYVDQDNCVIYHGDDIDTIKYYLNPYIKEKEIDIYQIKDNKNYLEIKKEGESLLKIDNRLDYFISLQAYINVV